jgi:predicted MPP superfamily phosphohydrolase
MRLRRRQFLSLGGALAVAGLGGYSLWEPHHIILCPIEIRLPRLASSFNGLRIVQMSDFHFDSCTPPSVIQKSIDLANAQKADLVLLNGDYVTDPLIWGDRKKAARNAYPCAEMLSQLRARLGVMGVLGNHDVTTDEPTVLDAFRRSKIPLLLNAAHVIEERGSRLWIAGVQSDIHGAARVADAIREIPKGDATLLLAHEPDYADEVSQYDVDLQLSGHSHGGQVAMPGYGPIVLPPLGKKYPVGFYRIGKLQLYTNSGIGTVTLPIRFYCPPEITVITLRSGL